MTGRIDTTGHATNNDQALRGEIAGQALGHPRTVGSRMTSSHHGNAGFGQQLGVTAHIKDSGRIIDFFQAGWIGSICDRDDGDTGVGSTRHFLASQFHRLSCRDGLGRNRLDAGALQFSQRGAEYGFRRSEMFGNLSGSRRAEPGRKRYGEPFQGMGS